MDFKRIYSDDISNLEYLVLNKFIGLDKSYINYIDEYSKLVELFNKYNIDINEFYYDFINEDISYIRLFYVHNGYILDIHEQSNILVLLELIKDTIIEFNEYFNKGINDNFLFNKLSSIHGPTSINFLYKYMDNKDLINVIKSIQKFNDYNANNICLDAIKLAYKDTLSLLDTISPDEYITVYRGEGSKSKSYLEAYSWSLSKDVALFFATRAFNAEINKSDMKLYKAIIPKKYIIGVIDDNEKEILVNPYCFNEVDVEDIDFDKSKQYEMPKIEVKSNENVKCNEDVKSESTLDDDDDIEISPALLNLLK